MQRDQLKKSIGYRIQLVPPACHLDHHGQPLPERDEDWIVHQLVDSGVDISNGTFHTTLGYDHIHHFTTNPGRVEGGLHFGFYTLNVQIFTQGINLWVRPNARPGEPVAPKAVHIQDLWVDINFPVYSGLQARLDAQGLSVSWARDSQLMRHRHEGCEVVVESDENGRLSRFHLRSRPEDLTLIKRRK